MLIVLPQMPWYRVSASKNFVRDNIVSVSSSTNTSQSSGGGSRARSKSKSRSASPDEGSSDGKSPGAEDPASAAGDPTTSGPMMYPHNMILGMMYPVRTSEPAGVTLPSPATIPTATVPTEDEKRQLAKPPRPSGAGAARRSTASPRGHSADGPGLTWGRNGAPGPVSVATVNAQPSSAHDVDEEGRPRSASPTATARKSAAVAQVAALFEHPGHTIWLVDYACICDLAELPRREDPDFPTGGTDPSGAEEGLAVTVHGFRRELSTNSYFTHHRPRTVPGGEGKSKGWPLVANAVRDQGSVINGVLRAVTVDDLDALMTRFVFEVTPVKCLEYAYHPYGFV